MRRRATPGTAEGRGDQRARQPFAMLGRPMRTGAALRFRHMVSVLTISGMVAVHSKRAVFTALSGVPGVIAAEVEMGRAVVEHDRSMAESDLRDAVAITGCTVTAVTTERRLPLRD